MILFTTSCRKDVTNEIDITEYSWSLKSIEIDGDKSKIPSKDEHGHSIDTNEDYILTFTNDVSFSITLSINTLYGGYQIPKKGTIQIIPRLSTYICCDIDFDDIIIDNIQKIKSYTVLGNTLTFNGDNVKIIFKK